MYGWGYGVVINIGMYIEVGKIVDMLVNVDEFEILLK